MERNRTALVLGATGGIGGAVAGLLQRRGWAVTALARTPPRDTGGLRWVVGDAMNRDDVVGASRGAALVVHAVNPPGYRDWDKLVLPMIDNTIAAAAEARARILLPGTVYNYGPDAWPDLREDAPQHPVTRKGAIRVALEQRLREAARGGVPALVVRAGDFFGPGARNNWFGQGLVKPGRPIRSVTTPGRPGVGHQWAYLPDAAEVMVRLAERDDLAAFETFHMDGHWDPDGTHMTAAIRRAVGRPDLPTRRFPWWLMRLGAQVVPLFREMAEMRCLWEQPIRMNGGRLAAALGGEPRTPLDEAVRATLAGLGCL